MNNVENIYKGYPRFESRTVDWLSSDGEETFKKHCESKDKLKLLKLNGWLKKKVTYRINKFGFRSNEFTDDSGVLFLGCSYTSGIGMPEDEIFPTLVAKELNLNCLNLGVAAGSNDTCFRIGSYWIPKLKPKIVVLISPHQWRFEIIDKNCNPEASPVEKMYKDWFTQELNQQLFLQKNIYALQYISSTVNAKFCLTYADTVFIPTEEPTQSLLTDVGRDLGHPGVKHHQNAAKNILKNL